MKKSEIEMNYHKYETLLHKLSHQAASRCGRPEDELFAEANYQFMLATESFQSTRGKFGTFLYHCVKNGLAQWGMRNALAPEPPKIEKATNLTPAKQAETNDWIANLSTEAREVVMIILNGPAEVLDLGLEECRRVTKGMIGRHLRAHGMEWKNIRRAMNEVKLAVKSF